MAKYEIEIDDQTACRLCGMPNLPTEIEVVLAAQYCLGRYAGQPDLVEPYHLAALAIVRANVAQHTQLSGDHQTHVAEADRLFNFVLVGR